jgi:hypothetical protein
MVIFNFVRGGSGISQVDHQVFSYLMLLETMAYTGFVDVVVLLWLQVDMALQLIQMIISFLQLQLSFDVRLSFDRSNLNFRKFGKLTLPLIKKTLWICRYY